MSHNTKQVWYSTIILICVFMSFGIIKSSITPIIASTDSLNEVNEEYPSLIVTKKIENAETIIGESFDARVVLGDTFIVSVTITNFGESTAYNVTFIDAPSNPWVLEIEGLTKISFIQIASNETQNFNYLMTAKSLGIYDLDPAQVIYYSSEINPTRFITFSNSLSINIIEPPEDFSLRNMNAAITFLIILIIGNLTLFFRLVAPKLNRRINET